MYSTCTDVRLKISSGFVDGGISPRAITPRYNDCMGANQPTSSPLDMRGCLPYTVVLLYVTSPPFSFIHNQLKSLKAFVCGRSGHYLHYLQWKVPHVNYSRNLAGFTTCRPLRVSLGGELKVSVDSPWLVSGVSGTLTGRVTSGSMGGLGGALCVDSGFLPDGFSFVVAAEWCASVVCCKSF